MSSRSWRLLAPLLLLLAAACAQRPCPEPGLMVLTDAKQAVIDYHTDGRYEADTAKVADAARSYVFSRLAQGVSGRPAVIFDVHQTLLDVFDIEKEMQFGYFKDVWDRRVEQGNLPPVRPVVALWQDLQAHGVTLFLISNTQTKHRDATVSNLHAVGVTDWYRLYLRPDDISKTLTAQDWKSRVRADLEAEGFTILAAIGDQDSDLNGGHAERTFKLPNYMWRLK